MSRGPIPKATVLCVDWKPDAGATQDKTNILTTTVMPYINSYVRYWARYSQYNGSPSALAKVLDSKTSGRHWLCDD